MISFNLIGNCVSRDMITPLIERGVQVLQYSGFVSPVSMFSEKGDCHIELDDMKDYAGTNFYKRSLCFDINKYSFNYIIAKKSDYLLVDILAARLDMLRKGNHFVTITYPVVINRDRLNKDCGFDKYERIRPFDIDDDEWNRCVDRLSELILNNYAPSQIILHKYYNAEKYVDGSKICFFEPKAREEYVRQNELIKKLDVRLESNLKGCHVIESPEFVLADKSNVRGLHPLHYFNDYYQYGSEALDIIMKKLPDNEERIKLEDLRQQYQEKFKIINNFLDANTQLKSTKNKLFYTTNALNFTKDLANDLITEGKFTKWLQSCAEDKKRVVILKNHDIAGQIICKALKKYGVEVLLESKCYNFSQLSADEIELCRKADIIISADVHSSEPIEYKNLKAVRIADLIKIREIAGL